VSAVEPSERLVGLLRDDVPTVVLTGAGVSAESGLATFRGAGGLWEGRDPTEVATPEAFARDPRMVWRFYAARRRQAAAASPNAGHAAIAALERLRSSFTLVTQNVDGLHERAGSTDVVRLHGTLWRLRCTRDGAEVDDDRADLGPLPPRCRCGGMLRPAVVWFGEALPSAPFRRAERAVRNAALVLVAGTSGLVHPAAALPLLAREAGAHVVEINPERTPLSGIAGEVLAGRSGEVLPVLVEIAGTARETPR
jgi:NAD-dependent deacetylase